VETPPGVVQCIEVRMHSSAREEGSVEIEGKVEDTEVGV